ncbi:MAG: heat-shock protein Hsp20 [Candidatus Dactylopiibacterium carminicum]|uniref:Heat-shock protein Hsp20 n=1 Tax=Candidatus Dactylopiibacterium carminicum TaxID=857335 RepID=A0A272ENB8_9RHOO|nr:Hsp20 family protein [Candidatus Dactylopiibacterium carminicum]KAF7597953.1 heat-shock protein Hsp20 [Candidatus Dactylopiibacterium carminicum]PAS91526.1 MAG: heat-shock protein Hsp20 [Candidatus Dactylopiibacterium carminicum]PAS93114.1 MAG: heat-shock protein Hsp20 [Candidatus Dactylopiibacterium carminicum]PAS96104.1 MAG: heat-shock protein Hsp20 [Candidatus Dactylopiibacterium carminicum]
MANIVRSDPFEDLLRGFFIRPVGFGGGPEVPGIRVDLRESDKEYTLHAELPGIRKEDIHVQIDGSVVSISAERKTEKGVKDGERLLHTERSHGKVSRSFDLGSTLDETHATASFTDGVLELILPKKAATKARRLSIS